MKKIMMFAIIAIMAVNVVAQEQKNDNAASQERMTLLFNAKVKMLKEKLLLTDEQTEKFIPIYKEYMTEMGKYFGKRRRHDMEVKTADEATKKVVDELDGKMKVLEVQKSFIPRCAKVLTPQQLLKLLPAESDIQHQVRKEFKKRRMNSLRKKNKALNERIKKRTDSLRMKNKEA